MILWVERKNALYLGEAGRILTESESGALVFHVLVELLSVVTIIVVGHHDLSDVVLSGTC